MNRTYYLLLSCLLFLACVVFSPIACGSNPTPAAPAPVTVLVTPTYTPTFPSGTLTATLTATHTTTPVSTSTFLPTATPVTIVVLATPLPTGTNTVIPTPSTSPSPTASPTPTNTYTLTATPTFTQRFHVTDTSTFTSTTTVTPTVTALSVNCPAAVAVGAGYIAVSDGHTDVQIFDMNNQFLYDIPTIDPSDLAIDSYGELYIAASLTGVLGYYLGPQGAVYDYTWTGQGNYQKPTGVKIDAQGNLVVANFSAGTIVNLAWEDDSILNQTTPGSYYPCTMAIDAGGNLYASGVDSSDNVGIFKFTPQYQFANSFSGSTWTIPMGFIYGVAVDTQGNLFLSDIQKNRVVYASVQGQYLGEIDGFFEPADLSMDTTDDLFVADNGNCLVKEFKDWQP